MRGMCPPLTLAFLALLIPIPIAVDRRSRRLRLLLLDESSAAADESSAAPHRAAVTSQTRGVRVDESSADESSVDAATSACGKDDAAPLNDGGRGAGRPGRRAAGGKTRTGQKNCPKRENEDCEIPEK